MALFSAKVGSDVLLQMLVLGVRQLRINRQLGKKDDEKLQQIEKTLDSMIENKVDSIIDKLQKIPDN